MISIKKWIILTPLQKFRNNVGNLGNIIATGFEWLHKVQKSPNLVTLEDGSRSIQEQTFSNEK